MRPYQKKKKIQNETRAGPGRYAGSRVGFRVRKTRRRCSMCSRSVNCWCMLHPDRATRCMRLEKLGSAAACRSTGTRALGADHELCCVGWSAMHSCGPLGSASASSRAQPLLDCCSRLKSCKVVGACFICFVAHHACMCFTMFVIQIYIVELGYVLNYAFYPLFM